MAEVGFPGQHTTTTTITSSTTVQTNIRFDPLYIRTLPGILKVVQVVSTYLIDKKLIEILSFSHISLSMMA